MNSTLFGNILILAGLALLAAGIASAIRQRARMFRWRRSSARVVELLHTQQAGEWVRVRSESGWKLTPKKHYRPVVEFTTEAGLPVRIEAQIFTRPADLRVGDSVEVLYSPEKPGHAIINRPLYLWFTAFLLVFFGVVIIGLGAIGVWQSTQKLP